VRYLHFVGRVRSQLDAEGVDYRCSYDDLTDGEYQQIRNALIRNNRSLRRSFTEEQSSDNEPELIRYVESVLMPGFSDLLTRRHQAIFAGVWFLAWLLPAGLWWYLYVLHPGFFG
jgi:hypothetical protein